MIDTIIVTIHSPREKVERRMGNKITVLYKGEELILHKSQLKLIGGNSTKINFSLTKFVQGNNLENVSADKLKIGVNALIELLDISPDKILLSRVDVAYSFKMEHSVHNYLSKFDMIDKFSKTFYPNGNIKYCNKNVTLSFYDKLLEMRQHRISIPVKYENLSNEILRYELQVRKNIKKVINYDSQEPLTILALKYDNFLDLLVEAWFFYFKKFLKSRVFDSNFLPSKDLIKKQSDLSKLLQYQGIKSIGAKNIEAFLKNDVKDAVTRSRMRENIKNAKEFASNFEYSMTKSEINRFAIKVKSVYYKKLSHLYAC